MTATSPDTTSTAATEPRQWRVLIADDLKEQADLLSMFFTMEGMDTVVAYDGAQAVELATTFHPDLVCSDLDMPVMDGFEAAKMIRDLDRRVIMVAISAKDGSDTAHRIHEAGFDAHLAKPVSPSELRLIIAALLPDTNPPD